MGYAQETGYVPTDIATIMSNLMNGINAQFETTYTVESFAGTNFYKYFYALAQELQKDETKTSEIFQKLSIYFQITNQRISRPVVTAPGILEKFASMDYVASVKPMIEVDAGKINICVDVNEGDRAKGTITITNFANLVSGTDDSVGVAGTTFTAQAGAVTPGGATFQAASSNAATATSLAAQINAHASASLLVRAIADDAVVHITALKGGTAGNSIALAYTDNDTNVGATKSGTALAGGTDDPDYEDAKLEICELISLITTLGAVTQGSESETIVLSNGQSFDFKFHLPDRIPVWLRLTNTLSDNNQVLVGSPDDVKIKLVENVLARYRLGRNFEPQRYYSVVDAPWTSQVLLEWTTDVVDGSLAGSPTWNSTIYESEFNELFEVALERVTLVEV